jgi:hypothetical protein
MWVLLGVSDDTVEKETFVYFIGVFDNLLLANRKLEDLMNRTYSKRSDYIIKSVNVNAAYDYNWSNSDEDEI